MSKWTEAYERAHSALVDAHSAIKHLLDLDASSDRVKDQLCCAGNTLQGTRALLEEAAREQKMPKPHVALDIDKLLKVARLRIGKKPRREWDLGTDVYKELDEIHKASPDQARLLMDAIYAGLFKAKDRGLFSPTHGF